MFHPYFAPPNAGPGSNPLCTSSSFVPVEVFVSVHVTNVSISSSSLPLFVLQPLHTPAAAEHPPPAPCAQLRPSPHGCVLNWNGRPTFGSMSLGIIHFSSSVGSVNIRHTFSGAASSSHDISICSFPSPSSVSLSTVFTLSIRSGQNAL